MRSIVAAALFTTALTLSGCSKLEQDTPGDAAALSDAPRASARTADTAPTAPENLGRHDAPGVAFDYIYHFALPRGAISAVQEQHVRACEQLGLARCRVTGMEYNAGKNDRISAKLDLKLAPDIARLFARDAVGTVEKSKGKLVNAAITGEDAGARLAESKARLEQIGAHRKVLEGQLARPGLHAAERESLRRELAGLGEEGVTQKLAQAKTVESVATTPMTFAYASTEGFGLGGNPLDAAAHASWAGTSTIVWLVTMALAIALPWLLFVAVIVLGWRSAPMRRLRAWLAWTKPEAAAPGD